MEAILEAPDADTGSGKRDRALFAAMYNTGARVSEIVGYASVGREVDSGRDLPSAG